jgi:NRAMP (natural resistance-associated macrophage protein)-like metal ion transporter
MASVPRKAWEGTKKVFRILGPGLVTGAADDDPSGIATYSQVGARFGYGMLWSMLFAYPLMAAIQEICARIGRVTGSGITGGMRTNYPRWLLIVVVFLVLFANVFNIGADVAAMGSALQLIIGGPSLLYSFLFGLVSTLLIVWIPYTSYVSYLKWLTLVLLAYILTAFVVHVPWGEALRSTIIPTVAFNLNSLTALTAVLGTTISPYLFIWQSSQEAEEVRVRSTEHALKQAPGQAPKQLRRIRWDTYFGMAVSNIVSYFIIMATAATLNASGTHNIDTAAQAAEALRPIGGRFAFLLFSLGIIGTGLLSLPVLAGSAAYAVSEAMHWPIGLQKKPLQAKAFYSVLIAAMIIGLAMDFFAFNPITALFLSAIINGVVAAPLMAILMHMASNPKVMGKFTLSPPLRVVGWLATAVMGGIAAAMLMAFI